MTDMASLFEEEFEEIVDVVFENVEKSILNKNSTIENTENIYNSVMLENDKYSEYVVNNEKLNVDKSSLNFENRNYKEDNLSIISENDKNTFLEDTVISKTEDSVIENIGNYKNYFDSKNENSRIFQTNETENFKNNNEKVALTINNNVSITKECDIDDVIEKLTEKIVEAVESSAEGIHI